jgi:hypothetical protein
MRTLSVGFPLPGPRTQNHDFAKAPSFFDFDTLVVDPNAVGQLIDDVVQGGGEHSDRSGLRVVNGPTSSDTLSLADLLRDRRDETLRLLTRGGLVVCFARPNVGRYDVAGLAGCDRYVWLPGPPGLAYGEPFLRRGAGSEIVVMEHEHPFGAFLHQFRARLAYDAYFDERAPGFASVRRVIARSAGGAPVAIELPVERGAVVFLPPPVKTPAGDERYAFSNALQRAAQGLLGTSVSTSPPSWLESYELPGLRERAAARDEAQQRLEEARSALAARDAELEQVDRYRRLLWQEGTVGLVGPVRSAFELLGFRVQAEDLDAPAELWPAQTRGRPPARPSRRAARSGRERRGGRPGRALSLAQADRGRNRSG